MRHVRLPLATRYVKRNTHKIASSGWPHSVWFDIIRKVYGTLNFGRIHSIKPSNFLFRYCPTQIFQYIAAYVSYSCSRAQTCNFLRTNKLLRCQAALENNIRLGTRTSYSLLSKLLLLYIRDIGFPDLKRYPIMRHFQSKSMHTLAIQTSAA